MVFCLQAEDGIRDLVRSRGLGDVYKRQQLIGDPTEGALWVLAEKGGLDPEAKQEKQPRIAEIPFDSGHKFMATFHQVGATVEMFIKGCLLYTSPSPRDRTRSRMPSSA